MPNWGEILKELNKLKENLAKTSPPSKKGPYDIIRRKYLKNLHKYTKRNTILYASKWTQGGNTSPESIIINEERFTKIIINIAIFKIKFIECKRDLIVNRTRKIWA